MSEKLKQLRAGEKVEVTVCHVESPSEFWVRPALVETILSKLHDSLMEQYEGKKANQIDKPLNVGMLVITK